MNQLVVYIKADLNIVVRDKSVKLKDIVKLYCWDHEMVRKLGERELFRVNDNKLQKYAVSILKVIEAIQKEYSNIMVLNVGEADFVVEYVPQNKRKVALELLKTITVTLVVFFGSAFTIMTFNEDVSVKDVLKLFQGLVMGDTKRGLMALYISYAIGLPLGIVLFFNHFSKIKMNTDPTPLQVQLRLYESNENKAIIENASREGKTIDLE